MVGPYKIEPRDLSRDSVNQINKVLAQIARDIGKSGTGTIAAPKATAPPPSGSVNLGGSTATESVINVNEGGSTPGPVGPQGPPATVTTDGVTIGGNGTGVPIFSFVLSSFKVATVPFASSPYSATLEEQQISIFLCSASAGADFIFNLPAATGSGNVAIAKKMDANAHNVDITPNGSDTIDGVNAAVDITVQYDVTRLVDATSGAWVIW